jgi:hypothetical protein
VIDRYCTFVPGSGAAEDDGEHNGKTDQHHVDGVQPGVLVAVVQQPAHNTGLITGIFNPKNCFYVLGNMIRDVHPGSGF